MSVHGQIEERICDALNPVHLEVMNESAMHNVAPGSTSHFKVIVVSDVFHGVGLVERHKLVNNLLKDDLNSGRIHALALHTYTPQEWEDKQNKAASSPKCLGGNSQDA